MFPMPRPICFAYTGPRNAVIPKTKKLIPPVALPFTLSGFTSLITL